MTPTASRAHDSLEDTVNLIHGIITESHRAFKAQLEDLTANVLALQAESTKEINLRRKETEKVEALASDVLALKAEITEKGKTQKFPNEEKIHEILRDFNKHIDNNIKDRLGLFGDGMIIRQNNHNSEVNRQRVEFEKRIESEWLYWREVTADQIQKKWDHVANRGSAALTRLENRIQSNFNIHLQDTERQIKAMRKKMQKKSIVPAMYNQIYGMSAQMTRMTQMVEEGATTMNSLEARMTEERERLGMTLERFATLEHSVATVRTVTANLDERVACCELWTTPVTRAEFEQVKDHVGDTRQRYLVLESFVGHTFENIFNTLNTLIEVRTMVCGEGATGGSN